MFHLILMLLLLRFILKNVVCQGLDPTGGEFNFNGYLYAAGSANLNSNGLFRLTNFTTQTAQIFYNFPFRFKESVNGNVYSFSTTFVFAIVSQYGTIKGHGLAFVLCPTRGLSQADPTQYLGLFNASNMGDPKNHILAVELDTVESPEFNDMNDNHVGIDINSLFSDKAASAGYFKDDGTFRNLSHASGDPMQVWVEYDSKQKQLNVTLHPIRVPKPKIPLLSLQKDLSPYLLEYMYVGFTSSTGSLTSSHYILLGWTFKMNGTAPDINPSRLPKIPSSDQKGIQRMKKILAVSLTLAGVTILSRLISRLMAFLEEKKVIRSS